MSRQSKQPNIIDDDRNSREAAPPTIMAIYRRADEWRHDILPIVSAEAKARGWRLLRGWHRGSSPSLFQKTVWVNRPGIPQESPVGEQLNQLDP